MSFAAGQLSSIGCCATAGVEICRRCQIAERVLQPCIRRILPTTVRFPHDQGISSHGRQCEFSDVAYSCPWPARPELRGAASWRNPVLTLAAMSRRSPATAPGQYDHVCAARCETHLVCHAPQSLRTRSAPCHGL